MTGDGLVGSMTIDTIDTSDDKALQSALKSARQSIKREGLYRNLSARNAQSQYSATVEAI